MKLAGTTALIGGSFASTAAGQPPEDFDYQAVDATNVHDAETPTVRLDNHNSTAAMIKIGSTGSLDGEVFTVGAHQAGYKGKEDGYPNATGKYVDAECGEVIRHLWSKRPQDREWTEVNFGTATVGGDGCD